MRIPLQQSGDMPLYRQIETYLRRQILDGVLAPETKLPASRQLAQELGVSRITVNNAYAILESEGLIYSKGGSGVYVLARTTQPAEPGAVPPDSWPRWQQAIAQKVELPYEVLHASPRPANRHPKPIRFTGVGDPREYPIKDLMRAMHDVLQRNGASALEYGGLDLPKVVASVIGEELAPTGGFSVTYAAHTSIGTLPLVYFGTEEQKARYLPKLASGEWIGAYCLTEPESGSDALAAKTRAVLSEDGRHYILNGTKQFITNSGFADLFTLFAKIDGEQFTGFLIERDTPGLSLGEEEKKLGIKSSSTRQVILTDCRVPVENVLGEIGKGHRIAFNVLNIGRFKIGAGGVGGSKAAIADAVAYANDRKQFGRPIASFPLIGQKFAEMATRTYVCESALYRCVGAIDEAIGGRSGADAVLAGIQEYAVECSILKVLGSETLDHCVDEGVQIHGGYGFLQDFPIERAYRDSRINRIFEGTNEINRLFVPGTLMRKAVRGELPLIAAATRLQAELREGGADGDAVGNLKRLALLLAGMAMQRFGTTVEQEQEILLVLADLLIDVYAVEAAVVRAEQSGSAVHATMARIAVDDAQDRARSRALRVLPRLVAADALTAQAGLVEQLTKRQAFDVIAAQREVAAAVYAAGGYPG
ncbi:MAG: acyl-CoA dehydrogenase [Chloroflexi bacterium]|nr:MAG: acyl-CoA dehydrogenase [Chloroflexota bacterium]